MKEVPLQDLAEFYKVFGDVTRIKILYTLFQAESGEGLEHITE